MTRARSLSQLANSSVFTVATNNRVGIGSEVPTAKLDVDGTLNVSGNATIGGVATYEDVTNVDSVGIVTARSGVSVPDGQKIQLGLVMTCRFIIMAVIAIFKMLERVI